MSELSPHSQWLTLMDISGPFLAEPVLKEVFPQGLEGIDAAKRRIVRQAYDEWRDANDLDDQDRLKLHRAWIDLVLRQGLELDEDGKGDVLKAAKDLPETIRCDQPEHGVTLRPDFAVVDSQQGNRPLMLISTYDPEVALDKVFPRSASPTERMVELCRATGVRLGLVTNGEQWMLVDAPVGAVTTFATWHARLWGPEPLTFQAFVNLLGIRRFFVDRAEQLPALFDNSLKLQDEVTDALGEQVRRAVEVLIQALDRADVDRNRELLKGVDPAELYEAGLTVMMRIVFLLSAEERGLLLMGDETYEANYAVSTLRLQLRAESEEILERRWDAWSRLLAIFRAVYGGIDHEDMRLPALGGSLFDPDRFPFLEGRPKGSNWKTDPATPLPMDNRTVLLLLDAVQLFQGRTLSYSALDVEQIGYVYEGLLERTVARASEVTLDLDATKNALNPWVSLSELDDAAAKGRAAIEALLKERTGSSASRVRNDLERVVDEGAADKLLSACHANRALRDRVKFYFHLLRTDPWGYPLVYPKGTFMVTTGTGRRETGSHYTPKSLTEAIVKEALKPLIYVGPAEGKDREDWQLKEPADLLDLRICDPAMGSGAFLVQVCRWLSERLVEAWRQTEDRGKAITSDGEVVDELGAREPLRKDVDERLLVARRLIAERCLYGVDMNPLAVELAKLSIWLVTLAKDRPFGFLDHNLRCGDSLLGIHDLDQLHYLDMNPGKGGAKKLFASKIDHAVDEAITLRCDLRGRPIRDIRDVELMARLEEKARIKLQIPQLIADGLVGELLAQADRDLTTTDLSIEAGGAMEGDDSKLYALKRRAAERLGIGIAAGKSVRRPFHWPLAFPEVFTRENGGFDAIVGNPPFMGNKFWKERLGDSFTAQARHILGAAPGKIDLCIVFHRRAADLLRNAGSYGLLATDNISEGSAISRGLAVLVGIGDIYFCKKGIPWPGKAAVSVSIICFFKGEYKSAKTANDLKCDLIGPRLLPIEQDNREPLELDKGLFSFEGVNNSKGLAFVIDSESEWFEPLRNESGSLLVPYVTGDDITSHALTRVSRWALDIADRDLEEIEKNFPIAYRFLMQVKPTRTPSALKSYNGLIDRWWQFWNHRATQMRRLRRRRDFIAYSKVTKFPVCILAPSQWIYTNQVALIGIDKGDELAIALSSLFRNWLERLSGGRLEGRLRLSISESIAKFPLPEEAISAAGVVAAQSFNDLAVEWAREHGSGMTDVMNAIHSPDDQTPQVEELRRRLVEIDTAVAAAYGWDDLDLSFSFVQHDARAIRDQCRFQISKATTAELFSRLVNLNREVSEGRHDEAMARERILKRSVEA
jgi:hypothetical protein